MCAKPPFGTAKSLPLIFNLYLAVHVIHQDPGEEQAAIASVTDQGGLALDPNIQYQLKAETSQGMKCTCNIV